MPAGSAVSYEDDCSTGAGDGSCAHLEKEVSLPEQIKLSDGLYELGREKPADIVIPLPTISSRHAMLRVGKKSALS